MVGGRGYSRWENFELVIKKAIIACENAGGNVDDHFRGVTEMVSIGSGAARTVKDYVLTRYACWYLYVLSISKFLSSDTFDADVSQGSGIFRFTDEKLF